MLIQFSVENFLSFDEEQVFSMAASTGDQMHPNHVVDGKGGPALRAAAMYGPNASGKSNLITAISFARDLIVNGTRRSQPIPVRPFKLRADSSKRSSKFEFVFRTQGVLYNYGFRVTSTRVEEEWLYATGIKKTETKLFERTTSENGIVDVEIGPGLLEGGKKPFYDFLAEGTRPNQLFLTEAAERNVERVMLVVNWFSSTLSIVAAESRTGALPAHVHLNRRLSDTIGGLVRAADTGILEISSKLTEVEGFPSVLTPQAESINSMLIGMTEDQALIVDSPDDSAYRFTVGKSGRIARVDLSLVHSGIGTTEEFSIDEESDGTKRLIHLAAVIDALRRSEEHVIVLDELDRRFHPHLSRLIVQTALENCHKESSNQLIFTTHDTNLLDLDLLRRDEIWFVEKDKNGASHIYSLAEFKVRPDLKIEKGYLNGRFGAIPFITPIDRLGWSDEAEVDRDKETEAGQAAA